MFASSDKEFHIKFWNSFGPEVRIRRLRIRTLIRIGYALAEVCLHDRIIRKLGLLRWVTCHVTYVEF